MVKLALSLNREVSAEDLGSLGSPCDPNLSLVCWSVSGKYIAAALEKVVNIWQITGMTRHLFYTL